MLEHDPEKREKLLGWCLHGAGVIVLLAIAGIAYVSALRPLDERIATWTDRADYLEAREQDADTFRAEHARLVGAMMELEKRTAMRSRRLPEEPLEADFLSQVAAAANQVGIKIGDYRPGVIRAREGHSQMEIQLSCMGPYRSLCQFLDKLSELDRLSQVVKMEVRAAGPESCQTTLTMVIFFRTAKPLETKPLETKPVAGSQGGAVHG